MDKLKPLIEHHFWILFFIVLLLPVIGWWPAASGLREETEKQISTIDSAFSAIPAGSQANQSWSEGLNKIAEKAEEQNQEERVFLWERQWKMMTWPNSILKKNLPDKYRDVINLTSRNVYKGVYDLEVERVWKTANPFDYETGKGTVLLDLETVPRETFGKLTPTSEELWDAQEDLWLLESLFKSIREVNRGAKNVTKSVLRQIDLIELVGGPGDYPDAESSSSGSSPAGASDGFSDEMNLGQMSFNSGDDGEGNGGSRGNRRSVSAGNVSFDPSDEFGEEQGRYIDFKEGTIYRKRGFYLEGVVDHERLPDLLVGLTNGSWPVTITRVQMVKLGSTGKVSTQRGGGGGFPGIGVMDFEEGEDSEGPCRFGRGGGLSRPTPSRGTTTSRSRRSGKSEYVEMARSAVNGNNLAKVAISGVIYICNPPEIAENAGADSTPEEVAPQEMENKPEAENTETPESSDTSEKKEDSNESDSATTGGNSSDSKNDKPETEKPTKQEANREKEDAEEKPAAESPPGPDEKNP